MLKRTSVDPRNADIRTGSPHHTMPASQMPSVTKPQHSTCSLTRAKKLKSRVSVPWSCRRLSSILTVSFLTEPRPLLPSQGLSAPSTRRVSRLRARGAPCPNHVSCKGITNAKCGRQLCRPCCIAILPNCGLRYHVAIRAAGKFVVAQEVTYELELTLLLQQKSPGTYCSMSRR